MIVDTVEVFELNIPLSEPFEISLGIKECATNILVRIETTSGTVGWGEGAPLEPITGETQASALAAASAQMSVLEGADLRDRRRLLATMRHELSGNTSSQFALETAMYDAYCRERRIPLAECFGGRSESITTDVTIPIVGEDAARRHTSSAVEDGFEDIKVKVGGDIAADLDRVRAVRTVAPDVALKVDANQGWTPKQAIQFIERSEAEALDVELVEQPVHRDDVNGLQQVTAGSSIPIAADEAVFSPADALRIVDAGAADVINIKAGKSGLTQSEVIADIATAGNVDLMIGCMLESAIGLHASAHLVAGVGRFSYIDLDGNFSFAEPVTDVDRGPRLDIGGPGIGVQPNDDVYDKLTR